ncbi:hypothetical protein B0H34DRAFT_677203 [Crassisporium funariophilum]|nr:hypothetical protein B0H34DRAFT_677203 [Crassisporium funariophilum]
MPEYREVLAHFFTLLWLFLFHQYTSSWYVIALWADASDKEAQRLKHIPGVKEGHVYQLTAETTAVRGSRYVQTSLWPHMWRKTPSKPNPPPIQTLQLRGLSTTNRAIILDLGPLHLKSGMIPSIRKVDKKSRAFRVVLALEFQDFVLAFLSRDLLSQPTWATSKESLPPTPPDLFHEYFAFLECVASWMSSRRNCARDGLACDEIRAWNATWSGIGVYTVCELFFDAGLSPFLTERELFDSPSRTARFCEAFWTFAHRSHIDLPQLLKQCTIDGILAPTKEQRLTYKDWLHVYAKDRVRTSPRLAILIDEYKLQLSNLAASEDVWYRDTTPLYDTFEPEYIFPALKENVKKRVVLGHLIFGHEQWDTLRGYLGSDDDIGDDPLSLHYSTLGLLNSNSHLRPNFYQTLLPGDNQNKRSMRKTYVYQGDKKGDKQTWSVTPTFPLNSRVDRKARNPSSTPNLIVGKERESLLFKHIVLNSSDVAIGPLEYCGNGRVIYTSHGEKLVSAVRGNPTLDPSLVERDLKGIIRRKEGLEKKGKRKGAMKPRHRKLGEQIKETLRSSSVSSRSSLIIPSSDDNIYPSDNLSDDLRLPSSDDLPSSDSPPDLLSLSSDARPLKKRRISQDKYIAMGGKENDIPSEQRSRRSCSLRKS